MLSRIMSDKGAGGRFSIDWKSRELNLQCHFNGEQKILAYISEAAEVHFDEAAWNQVGVAVAAIRQRLRK